MIKGVPVGGSGSFGLIFVPDGSVILTGAIPVWVSDNPQAVAVPSSDGLNCAITVDPAAPVGGSFNLKSSVPRTDGTEAAGTASIPFLPAPAVEVVSFEINQIS